MLSNAYIPYRGYYSTPFVRWQGSLSNEHSIVLGAATVILAMGEGRRAAASIHARVRG